MIEGVKKRSLYIGMGVLKYSLFLNLVKLFSTNLVMFKKVVIVTRKFTLVLSLSFVKQDGTLMSHQNQKLQKIFKEMFTIK